MLFRQIFEPHLAQYAYLIGCQKTKEALIVDPQRDIDRYIEAAEKEGLKITSVAETHIHADYLSGVREFVEQQDVNVYLSDEGNADWKYEWAKDGGPGVHLVKNGNTFRVGNIKLEVIHTPGHTPEHICFLLTDEGGGAANPMGLISGDFVFVGDLGRPDLLETAAGEVGAREPSAQNLYESVQHLMEMPGYLQIWPGHGAGSACGKALGSVPQSTLGYELMNNASILASRNGQQAFVDAILDGQPEPPLYFARMKRENKMGPAILGGLPEPEHKTLREVEEAAGNSDAVVLDTRSKPDFYNGHLKGSLLAPFGKSLPTVAGSYIKPEQSIYLIGEKEQIDTIVRDLIRIGLDKIEGYITSSELSDASLTKVEVIDFAEVENRKAISGIAVVDVRRQDEVDRGIVEGSIHIPHVRLLERIKELPEDKTLLVHCQSGVRSAVASALLNASGFNAVYVNDHFRNVQHAIEPGSVAA